VKRNILSGLTAPSQDAFVNCGEIEVDFPESVKTAPFQSKKLAFCRGTKVASDLAQRQAGVLEGFEKIEVALNNLFLCGHR
jgi:hypothetical protein